LFTAGSLIDGYKLDKQTLKFWSCFKFSLLVL